MDKASRILTLFCRLLRRERLNKAGLMEEYKITSRSVERDFQLIRNVLAELHEAMELVYNRIDESYSLSSCHAIELNGMDAVTMLNIFFGCNALRKDELYGLISFVRELLSEREQRELRRFIEEGLKNYQEPLHGKAIIKMQWDLQVCIEKHQKIRILYESYTETDAYYDILPIRITFADSCFLLIATVLDKQDYTEVYRVDRIISFTILGKNSDAKTNNKEGDIV